MCSKKKSSRLKQAPFPTVVSQTLALDRIDQLLTDKKQWIKNKIVLHREVSPVSEKHYVSGESFSYLGRHYRLKLNRGNYTPVKLVRGRLVVTMPNAGKKEPHMTRNALVRWFKHNAERKLQEKVERAMHQSLALKPRTLASSRSNPAGAHVQLRVRSTSIGG